MKSTTTPIITKKVLEQFQVWRIANLKSIINKRIANVLHRMRKSRWQDLEKKKIKVIIATMILIILIKLSYHMPKKTFAIDTFLTCLLHKNCGFGHIY